MSDSFFDVPAGYRDADLDMAELEARGTRYARRFRGFTIEQIEDVKDGHVLHQTRRHGPDGAQVAYEVLVRSTDADEVGPCLEYSVGDGWYPTAKQAREAQS